MAHQAAASMSAGNMSNFPSAAACATTFSKPPALPPTRVATRIRPTTMTTVWNKSVKATDHMPPNTV